MFYNELLYFFRETMTMKKHDIKQCKHLRSGFIKDVYRGIYELKICTILVNKKSYTRI